MMGVPFWWTLNELFTFHDSFSGLIYLLFPNSLPKKVQNHENNSCGYFVWDWNLNQVHSIHKNMPNCPYKQPSSVLNSTQSLKRVGIKRIKTWDTCTGDEWMLK